MNNQIPSISQFLDDIDPNKTIDREKAVADITSINFLKSLDDFLEQAPVKLKTEIQSNLESSSSPDFNKILELIQNSGNMETFLSIVNKNIDLIRVDYIKTHLENLPKNNLEPLYSKYPSLKNL